MTNQVIATENLVVHDDVLNIDRQLIAGQPVPPDLVSAYRAKVGDEQAAKDPGADARDETAPTQPDYDGPAEDLEAHARKIGIYDSIEGTGAKGNVVKGDVVAALKAHYGAE